MQSWLHLHLDSRVLRQSIFHCTRSDGLCRVSLTLKTGKMIEVAFLWQPRNSPLHTCNNTVVQIFHITQLVIPAFVVWVKICDEIFALFQLLWYGFYDKICCETRDIVIQKTWSNKFRADSLFCIQPLVFVPYPILLSQFPTHKNTTLYRHDAIPRRILSRIPQLARGPARK